MSDESQKKVVYDPLVELLNYYASRKKDSKKKEMRVSTSVEDRLKHRIIDGEKKGLEDDLKEAMKAYKPLDIINTILLDGMKVVGDLFGRGEMQLPFVLQSAEVMKAAVAFLEPHMDKAASTQKGTMVLATVKGDVHDIGKNLVDIILTNNGYRVVNLGIKVAIDTILRAVEEHKADAIGMSGLLVKSTMIMKENLEVMIERGLRIPVLLGGAALTRRYVDEDLGKIFDGLLFYCEDAFAGLRAMERIASGEAAAAPPREDPLELPADSIAEVVKRIRIVRHKWNKALEYVSDEDFVTPDLIGSWSLADGIAHIIGWEEILVERLDSLNSNRPEKITFQTDDGVDQLNASFVAKFSSLSRESLMEQWNEIQAALIRAVQESAEDILTRKIDGQSCKVMVAESSYAHEYKHLHKVHTWLQARQGGKTAGTGQTKQRSNIAPPPDIPKVPFLGSRVVDTLSLDDVYPFINEIALFRGQWQFTRGKMSPAEHDSFVKKTVEPIFRSWKLRAKEEKRLIPRVVYGYYPCQSEGDDLVVYDVDAKTERVRFTFPRQTKDHFFCISDFFADAGSDRMDVLACMLVTVGQEASEFSAHLFEANNYADYLYFHGLSVETAEAVAEYWHKQIRREMGFATEDSNEMRKLFQQAYRGSRYSFGYPACPNLEDQVKLFELLEPERIGVSLTEEYHLVPEQSTSAIVVHHPGARYFNL